MHLPIALVLVSVLTFSPAISAQSHSVLPRTTTLPASTRAMALGDSYVLNSGKADVLFYHPALLARATGFGGSLQRWGSASSAASMSGAFEFLGGTLGIGLRTLQYATESEDELHAPLGQDHHFRPGGERSHERTASIGYGRELWGALSLGLAIDLLEIRLESLQQNIMLIDFGISADLGPIGVGLTAHDIGNKPFHDVPDEPFEDFGPRPSRIVLGAGAEIGYYPVRGRTFVLRIGLQNVPQNSEMSSFTTGFAFWLDDFILEWAFRPVSSAPERGSHRFGISWR